MCEGAISIYSKTATNANEQLSSLKELLTQFDPEVKFGDFTHEADDLYTQYIESGKELQEVTGLLEGTKLFQVYNLR